MWENITRQEKGGIVSHVAPAVILYESKIPDIEAGLASAARRIDTARADGDLAGCRSPSTKRDGMSTQEILIVGGYGVVGRRIANELAADYSDRVVVAAWVAIIVVVVWLVWMAFR